MKNVSVRLTALLIVALAAALCFAANETEEAVQTEAPALPVLGMDLGACEEASSPVEHVDFSKMTRQELDKWLEDFGGTMFTEVSSPTPACPTLQKCPNASECFPQNCRFTDTRLQKCSSGSFGFKCKPGTTIHIVSCQCLPTSGPPFPVCFNGYRDLKLVCR